MSLLAKFKSLNDFCYIIKMKEVQALDEITLLKDVALLVAREKLKAEN